MRSREYVLGMLKGAQMHIDGLYWFQFIKRSKARGVIMACKLILENKA